MIPLWATTTFQTLIGNPSVRVFLLLFYTAMFHAHVVQFIQMTL